MNVQLVVVTEAGRAVIIDSSIDTEADAKVFAEAVAAFDQFILCCGRFSNTDSFYLNINGKDIDYAQISNEDNLKEFLIV